LSVFAWPSLPGAASGGSEGNGMPPLAESGELDAGDPPDDGGMDGKPGGIPMGPSPEFLGELRRITCASAEKDALQKNCAKTRHTESSAVAFWNFLFRFRNDFISFVSWFGQKCFAAVSFKNAYFLLRP